MNQNFFLKRIQFCVQNEWSAVHNLFTIPYRPLDFNKHQFANSTQIELKRAFYSKGINVAFRNPDTRNKLVHPKDKSALEDRTGIIYKVSCAECDSSYIGETGRSLKDRLKEHKRAFRLNNPGLSAVADHAIDTGHKIEWDDVHIIDYETYFWPRKVKEAIWIKGEVQ